MREVGSAWMLLRVKLKLSCPLLSQQEEGTAAAKQFCKLVLMGFFIKINMKNGFFLISSYY